MSSFLLQGNRRLLKRLYASSAAGAIALSAGSGGTNQVSRCTEMQGNASGKEDIDEVALHVERRHGRPSVSSNVYSITNARCVSSLSFCRPSSTSMSIPFPAHHIITRYPSKQHSPAIDTVHNTMVPHRESSKNLGAIKAKQTTWPQTTPTATTNKIGLNSRKHHQNS